MADTILPFPAVPETPRDKVSGMLIRCAALLLLSWLAFAEPKSDPWKPAQVLHPAELVQLLQGEKPPVIFMVGPRLLYNGDHIRGALYAGPAGTPAGIELLKQQAGQVRKDAGIVLYCGCCPMEKCPNIRPAFTTLNDAGYTDVRILEVPTNLHTDWTAKGYPVEKGDISK